MLQKQTAICVIFDHWLQSMSSCDFEIMPTCPHCQQKITSETVTCPHCRQDLKAYGHPGIPLYYAKAQEYLCDRCVYHHDDTCTFPQRPYAKTCTLFLDQSQQLPTTPKKPTFSLRTVQYWCDRHRGFLLLFSLLLISLVLAVF